MWLAAAAAVRVRQQAEPSNEGDKHVDLQDIRTMKSRATKRLAVLVLFGGLLAGGTVTVAAPAHADEISYLQVLASYGMFPKDDDYRTLLRWGYEVCADAQIGRTVGTSINNVYYAPQNTISLYQAQKLVESALIYLC